MLPHSGRVFAYDLHGKCWERRSATATTAIRALDAAVTAGRNGGVRWLTAGGGGGGEMIPEKPVESEVSRFWFARDENPGVFLGSC